jgi:hypothetical protein
MKKACRVYTLHAFYNAENSSTSELKRFSALSIGSGVVKSTPAFFSKFNG